MRISCTSPCLPTRRNSILCQQNWTRWYTAVYIGALQYCAAPKTSTHPSPAEDWTRPRKRCRRSKVRASLIQVLRFRSGPYANNNTAGKGSITSNHIGRRSVLVEKRSRNLRAIDVICADVLLQPSLRLLIINNFNVYNRTQQTGAGCLWNVIHFSLYYRFCHQCHYWLLCPSS